MRYPCKKSRRRRVNTGFDLQYEKYCKKLKRGHITPINFLRKIIILSLLK